VRQPGGLQPRLGIGKALPDLAKHRVVIDHAMLEYDLAVATT
jgi:hypothetical protein